MGRPFNVSQQVAKSLEVARRVLDTNKNPVIASDVDHQYEDKYALVEFLTNTGIAAFLNVLQQLDGFNEEVLKQVILVVKGQQRSMTLRLACEEDCELSGEHTRTIETPTHQVTVDTSRMEDTGDGTPNSTSSQQVYSHKIVKEVREYHWKAGIRHRLILFAGTDPSMGIVLGSRTGMSTLVTRMKKAPYPPNTRSPIDLDLTWMMGQIGQETLECSFKIDREQAKTPRRNKQTEEALSFIQNLILWTRQTLTYFQSTIKYELLSSQSEETPADWLRGLAASGVFVPLVPFFQEYERDRQGAGNAIVEKNGLVTVPTPTPGSPVLPLKDTTLFLNEQCRTLQNALLDVAGNYPDPNEQSNFISGYEGKLVLLSQHLSDIARQWHSCIDFVEQMLFNQLVSAIGKELASSDFNDFMKFHNQRLMGKSFSPKPFCHAIRQPNQYPDGVLSVVSRHSEEHPIDTFTRHIPGDSLVAPMCIPLNEAATVDFLGDQYLHGWLDTHFLLESHGASFYINARARQFSW